MPPDTSSPSRWLNGSRVVDVDEHDVDVADVALDVGAAVVVDAGGDMPALGCVGTEPPGMLVPVGERDAPRAGWRDVAGSPIMPMANPSAVQQDDVHRGRQVRATEGLQEDGFDLPAVPRTSGMPRWTVGCGRRVRTWPSVSALRRPGWSRSRRPRRATLGPWLRRAGR